jgi:hypothetical protein
MKASNGNGEPRGPRLIRSLGVSAEKAYAALKGTSRWVNLAVTAAVLAWLAGTIGFFLSFPRWVSVTAVAVAVGAGIAQAGDFRRRPTLTVAAVVLVIGGAAYLTEHFDSGESARAIPPPGTVIDAQTGRVATNIQHITPQNAQIDGGSIFRACDRTTEHPCKWNSDERSIEVHKGDLIEFGILLHNGGDPAVPYLRLTVERWGGGMTPERQNLMSAILDLQYHSGIAHGVEARAEFIAPGRRGFTDLNYVPSSTVLLTGKHRFVAQLPDGIMDNGIALANVGSPASCYYCDMRYTRFVFFKARVNQGAT